MLLITRQTLEKATVSFHPLTGLVLVGDPGWWVLRKNSGQRAGSNFV